MFWHRKRAALGIGIIFIHPCPQYHLALIGLADIHMHRIGHNHRIQNRLDRLGYQRLQRAAGNRQANSGHLCQNRRMASDHTAHFTGFNQPFGGFDAGYLAPLPTQSCYLAILNDIHPHIIGSTGIAPCHRIMAGCPAPLLQKAAHHRIADGGIHIHNRDEFFNFRRAEDV